MTTKLEEFIRNRNGLADELAKHRGRHVALSKDGTKILASDEDPLKLIDAVKALGLDPAETVIEDVPVEETFLGGSFLFGGSDEEASA